MRSPEGEADFEPEPKEELEEDSSKGLREKLGSARERAVSFMQELAPSREQVVVAALAAGMLLLARGDTTDAQLGKSVANCGEKNVEKLSEGELGELREKMERLMDVRTATPKDIGEVTVDKTKTPVEQVEEIEIQAELEKFEPSVTVVDIEVSSPEEVESLLKTALGDEYISRAQLIEEFGEDYESKWGEVADKYPKAILHRYMDTYVNHGENVVNVMEKIWREAGLESPHDVEVTTLQSIFDDSCFTNVKDELGNKGVSIDFDEKRIIELLKNDPNQVINFSFQVGNVEVFVEEREKVVPKVDLALKPDYVDENGNYRDIPDYGNPLIWKDDRISGDRIMNKEDFLNEEIAVAGGRVGPPEGGRIGSTAIYRDQNGQLIGYVDGKTGERVLAEDANIITQAELRKRWEAAVAEAEKNAEIVDVANPESRIVGAYDREKAEENLPKLFEIANAYPDKLFVVAGGNEGEDIRDALEKLSEERPPNLLIVAEWGRGKPYADMRGADIYVQNSEAGIDHGSSFSTPVVNAYASALFEQGLSMEEVLEKIKSTTDAQDYIADYTKEQASVFDVQEALTQLESLKGTEVEAMQEIIQQKKQKAGQENFMREQYERKHTKK